MRAVNRYYLDRPDVDSMTMPHEIGRVLLPRVQGVVTIPTIYGFPLTINIEQWDGELNGSVERNLYFLGTYEAGTLDAMRRSHVRDGTFVDVGGHLGVMTIYMAKVGQASKVMTFEPNPRTQVLLRQNISLNSLDDAITLLPIGLGAERCKAGLIETADNSGMTRVNYDAAEADVSIEPLDSILAEQRASASGLPPVRLIKIDVEGQELHVLQGAQHTLQTYRPDLVVEYVPSDNNAQLLEMLKDLKYQTFVLAKGRHRISPLIPFTPDSATGQNADNLFCYQSDSPAHPRVKS